MMMTYSKLSIALLASLSIGLTACGGSGNGSSDNSNNTDNTVKRFDGTWIEACTYDASENEAEIYTSTINGNTIKILYSQYTTQDCSDTATLNAELTADLEYQGEQATGDCTAEKIKVTVTAGKLNGATLTDSQLATAIERTDIINSPQYDLLCIDSENALRTGNTDGALDGSSATKRPTTMDMSGEGSIKQ